MEREEEEKGSLCVMAVGGCISEVPEIFIFKKIPSSKPERFSGILIFSPVINLYYTHIIVGFFEKKKKIDPGF